MITYDEFKKVELKVGEVKTAERVVGSEKLLKLIVEIGEPTPRQIIAGIGKVYAPETLVGKQIVIVTNLESRMLMGLESQGMVLATHDESGPIILLPERPAQPGAVIS